MRFEQKEKRKLEIIIASIDIFITKGYTGTRIQDIADSANMSVGLLFHYFKNKEDLFNELTKIAVEGTIIPYGMQYTSIYDFFCKLSGYLLDSIINQPYRAKIFAFLNMVKLSNDVPLIAKKRVGNENIYTKIEEFIRLGQQEGSISNENPHVLVTLYWAMIQSVMDQYIENPKMSLPQPETLVSIFLPKENRLKD